MTGRLSNFSMSQLNHAAGIFADMSVDGPAIGTLVAIVDRAKNLPNRKTMGKQNPYCAARLGKEARKTETDLRGGQTPRWDSELRFTVHESPDYFRLKVSVFNDDKKTELIGETWIDLVKVIIPGGGQSDSWHPLQSKGRYAGEVRIEMTYYDTRPEDEAVIERRTGQTAEKIHAKATALASASAPAIAPASATSGSTKSSSSSLSGPRQLKEVKRRPLPSDPASSLAARPPPPEKVPSAPAPTQPLPARPTLHEPPTAHAAADYAHRPRSHSGLPEAQHDMSARPIRGYDAPSDVPKELHHPAPVHPPVTKRYTQDIHHSYREPSVEDYEPRPVQQRQQPEIESVPAVDYRSSRRELPPSREQHPSEPVDMMSTRSPYEAPPRQSPRHNYPFASTEQYEYNPEPAAVQYGQVAKYSPRSSGSMHEYPPAEYSHPQPEPSRHYRSHSNSLVSNHSRFRNSVSRDDMHSEYATMQPRVEDEDEDGPPPPPPVHRSGLVKSSQPMVPSPTPSYQAYSPEYAPSPRASNDLSLSQSSYYDAEPGPLQDPLHTDGPPVPPSLVAGYDPVIAEEETDRAVNERRASRGRSVLFEDDIILPPQVRDPSPVPPYPVERAPSPSPVNEHAGSMVIRRKPSASPDNRIVPRRKSVSPQPPLVGERPVSSIPFSPDSYDTFNPNAARSAVIRNPAPAYDTPAQAAHAAMRSEAETSREPVPIIDDNGREIDPSDHLPSDTWAPEPERKTKKPGVIVRFKNSPTKSSSAVSPPASSYRSGPPRVTFKPQVVDGESYPGDRNRWSRPQSYTHRGASPMDRTPPRDHYTIRGRETYSYGNGPVYTSPNTGHPARSPRGSVSPIPSPGSRSPVNMYAPANPGPPIPSKVPITQPMNQSYPVMASNTGMDALSRELNTIDIGCSNPQRAVRKYVPKTISTGYAI
ncbi:hypothetical protein AWENTII_012779 [Aspergillus wentii]